MLFRATALVAFLSLVPPQVHGVCSDNEKFCSEHSGVCTNPLLTYIESGSSPRTDIFNTLRYGRYCGAANKCIAENIGSSPNLFSDYCADNDIDLSCLNHDLCLDGKKDENGGNPRIPSTLRCECEYNFVYDLYQVYKDGGVDDQLCDKEFYELAFVPDILREEELMAVPFCVSMLTCIAEGRWPKNDDEDEAVCFCKDIFPKLSPFGIPDHYSSIPASCDD